MLKNAKNVLAVLVLLLIFIPASFAQQPAGADAAQKPDGEKGFKSKVFEVKHRDADSLVAWLRKLTSGPKATISASSEFKTIVVRDFPENLVTIEESLKRLDTPIAPLPNLELHMHVLVASNAISAGSAGQFPAELRDVLTQLRQTLNYRNYELATSVVQRFTETSRGLQSKGTFELSRSPTSAGSVTLPYQFEINSVSLAQTPAGAPTVQIGEFEFSTGLTSQQTDNRTQVQTALNLRDGEKVVVGTASFGDRALIIVLTVKFIN